MKDKITFEIWKNKRVIVIRNQKGQIISRRNQKGSGLRTRRQAYNLYRRNFSLSAKTTTVSKRNSETTVKRVNRVVVKGRDKSKSVNVKKSGFRKAIQIGKNTAVFRSKKVVKSQKHYQYVARVKWGDTSAETIGYSDIRGTKKQAFNRARADAINKSLISYDHKIKFETSKTGFAFKQNDIVYFEVSFEVQTYVNSTKSYEAPQTQRT